jgi:hypothetical protein
MVHVDERELLISLFLCCTFDKMIMITFEIEINLEFDKLYKNCSII